MSTNYHIYSNGGSGGPIDYSTVIATVTSGTTWSSAPLASSASWAFGVRAFDSESTLEERNVDAVATIVLDSGGNNITNRPIAPRLVTATPTAAAGVRVDWHYPVAAARQPWKPTGFHVYAGTPTVSYGSPVATVPYSPGLTAFSAAIAGLTAGSLYQIVVRAYNASGIETNTTVVTVTPTSAGPAAVVGLSGAATSQIGDGRS